MNILKTLKVYASKWQVKEERPFSDEELAAIDSAVVVASEYGNSVCLYLHAGGQSFIPLANTSTKGVGEEVDLKSAKLVTLEKQGEADIFRVDC